MRPDTEPHLASVGSIYERELRPASNVATNTNTNVGVPSGLKTALEFERLLGSVPRKRLNRWYLYHAVKRGLDIVGATLGLVCLFPLLATIALLIKLQDGGPVLFGQRRVGKNGDPFWFYKFRSMVPDAEAKKAKLMDRNEHADPRTFKMKQDPRITPLGRVLRRLSLDELPQLYNVLIGDMSLVGPRPATTREFRLYTNSDKARVVVQPGLTCIWQVSGRGKLDFSEQLKLDLDYIEKRSLWLDVRLIILTIPAVLTGDGAS